MFNQRKPCPHCGFHVVGIGYGHSSFDGKDQVSVKCYGCGSRGPFCATEDEAWTGWNTRLSSDQERLDSHITLCRKNLKSNNVKCCAACPFEDMIVEEHQDLKPLFEEKRSKLK